MGLEGTGGSGTSEMTSNLYEIYQNNKISETKDQQTLSGRNSNTQINLSEDLKNFKAKEASGSLISGHQSPSQFGYSSSHISYQFQPSNQQVSFANTNSGSKVASSEVNGGIPINNRDSSTPMSLFIAGPDQIPPEAIHVNSEEKMNTNKIEKIGPKQSGPFGSSKHFPERPPSCGSLKGCIIAGMGIPFENRKFSIESVKSYKSLKSKELLPSKNSKGRESSIKSENMSL